MDRVAAAWACLADVADPEIPTVSVVDLGIVRDVQLLGDDCVVTITPTYSGCPATDVIGHAIEGALSMHGFGKVQVLTQLSPAWTTDWMTDKGRAALLAARIAPPTQKAVDLSSLRRAPEPEVACPHCGSPHTHRLSEFGSTSCKALYRCLDCREPFDYFKSH